MARPPPPVRSGLVHRQIRTRDRILKFLALRPIVVADFASVAVAPAGRVQRRLPALSRRRRIRASREAYQRQGRASLVIYRSGAASMGALGNRLPKPGQRIYSVRQNLSLLVKNGHPTAAALGAWTYWGATLGGGELVARSALGENAKGQLIYAASMSASPGDVATALIRFGARSAMELDINPE